MLLKYGLFYFLDKHNVATKIPFANVSIIPGVVY